MDAFGNVLGIMPRGRDTKLLVVHIRQTQTSGYGDMEVSHRPFRSVTAVFDVMSAL
jgi:hypothetical protein